MPFPEFNPTIPTFVRTLTERFADREMIVLNDHRITYAEADARSAQLARGLLAAGIGKGTRVGLLMPNGPNFVIAFLAAARIGALVIPFNTFYKARELSFVMRHADIDTFLTLPKLLNNDYLARLEECAPELSGQKAGALALRDFPYLRRIYVWGGCDRPWAQSDRDLLACADATPSIDEFFLRSVEDCVTPADPVVLIYSSGSTAEPKGALHTHGTVVRHSFNLNQHRDIVSNDRTFSPMPFFWVGGLVFSLFSNMHKGAFMICEESFEPGETLALLEGERATIVASWPHYAKAMVDHPSFPERDLSSVRAGTLYEVLPEEARPSDPELRSNSLGMTETCGPHSIARMDVDLPEQLRGSFGLSVEGLTHKIVDPETGECLPPGSQGEIFVRGYSLMQGLYKQEREETFEPDGFYATGDAGHLDEEGYLFFKARLGEMIKTSGANVAPREVETVIDSFPEVQVSYVVGLPDPVKGQLVAAAIVLNHGASLDSETTRERLRSDLSSYKVPRHVFFFEKNALPFTDSGKIEKRKLAELLAEKLASSD